MSISNSLKTKEYNILIVDDYELVSEGVKEVLTNNKTALNLICDTANDGAEALQKVKQHDYDLVLMDFQLPFKNGDEVTAELLIVRPELKVLGFSYYNEALYMKQMRDAGAMGYVLKSVETSELLKAIEVVLGGGSYFPPPR